MAIRLAPSTSETRYTEWIMMVERKSDTLSVDAMTNSVLNWYALSANWMRDAGAEWYPSANRWAVERAAELDVPVEYVAAIVAAFSPQTRWIDNLVFADKFLRTGQRATGAMWSSYERAQRVANSPDPVVELTRGDAKGQGGPKMFAFARNILGDTDNVTVDVWAARAALGMDDKSEVNRVLKWVGGYQKIADAYRKAAAELGIPASVLQATVWITIRGRAD